MRKGLLHAKVLVLNDWNHAQVLYRNSIATAVVESLGGLLQAISNHKSDRPDKLSATSNAKFLRCNDVRPLKIQRNTQLQKSDYYG